MIIITVSTTDHRYTASEHPNGTNVYDESVTPRRVFEGLNAAYSRATVSLNGTILSAEQLDAPISSLTTATSVSLNAITKGDGAC